jgi:hypothetical protein
MAREQITAALDQTDLDGIEFALRNEFTNPPADVRRPDGDTVAFRVRISDGKAWWTTQWTSSAICAS